MRLALGEGSVMLTHLFPIGAYVQAPANFGMWKSRGVNTMVVVPDGNSEKAWNKAAIRDGLYEIRHRPATRPAMSATETCWPGRCPMSLTT